MSSFNKAVWLSLFLCFGSPAWAEQESISVDLRKGANDPLIDFVPPPFGSADSAQFSKDGLRIRQYADSGKKPTGVAGFKSTLAGSGDFKAVLDLKVNTLTPPSEGWGHGVILSIFLADPLQTTLKLNQVALHGSGENGVQSVMEISGRKIKEPTYISGPPLEDGLMIIERIGKEAVFSIQPKGASTAQEIARAACPSEDIICVEVWSTRVEKGNAPADVTFRQLTLNSDGFYSYKGNESGWFNWWTGGLALQIAVVVGLVIYMQSRK